MDGIDIRFEGQSGFERIVLDATTIEFPIVEDNRSIPTLDVDKLLNMKQVERRIRYRTEVGFWELNPDYIEKNSMERSVLSAPIKIPNHRVFQLILNYPLCSVSDVDDVRRTLGETLTGQTIAFEIGYGETMLLSDPAYTFVEPIERLDDFDCWKLSYFDGQYDEREMTIHATVDLVPTERIRYYI